MGIVFNPLLKLAELIGEIIGYQGKISYNTQKPDGTPRKLMDVSKIKQLGWSPQVALREGILLAYKDFLNQINLKKV